MALQDRIARRRELDSVRSKDLGMYFNSDGTPKTVISTGKSVMAKFGSTERTEKQLKDYWKYYELDNMVFASINTIAYNTIMCGYQFVSENPKAKQLIQMMFDRMDVDGVLLDNVIYGLVCGDSFIEKVKGKLDEALLKKAKTGKFTVSLKTASPFTMQINQDIYGRETDYQQKIGGQLQPTKLTKEDIIHLRFFPKPDSPYGISLLGPSKDTIDKMRDVDESIYNAIQRHTPKYVVTVGSQEEIPPKAVFDKIKTDLEDISSKNEFIVPGVITMSTIDESGVPSIEAYTGVFQSKTLVGLLCPQEAFSLGAGGSEACNDIVTEVLTKDGWKFYYELRDSDEIATYNPLLKSLEFVNTIDSVSKYTFNHDGEMIKIKNKHTDMLVTPNHRLWVRKYPFYKNRDWEFRTAEEIMNSTSRWAAKVLSPEYFGGIDSLTDYEKEITNKWGIDNFLKFLGFFVSEGSVNSESNCIRISQKKPEHIEEIRNILNLSPFKISEKFFEEKGYYWSFWDKEFHNYLMVNYGIDCYNRKIPRNIIYLPKDKLELLLSSAIKGDGTKGKGMYAYEYTTTSKQLIENIQEIAIRCGNYTSMRFSKDKRANRKGQWRLSIIKLKNNKDYYTLMAKDCSKVQYNNTVYSLNVPNHIYYTRRNGYVVIHGNTANVRALMFERFIKSIQHKLETQLGAELINQILVEHGYDENLVHMRFNSVTDADEERKAKWIGNLFRGFPEGKKPLNRNEVRALFSYMPVKGGDDDFMESAKGPAIQPAD
jgi:hypothetical protein